MKKRLGKTAIATTTLVCATLFPLDLSGPSGISLSTDSAQARVGRPLTAVSVAGVARRQYRRSTYGYGAGVVGAGLAAGAVAAATSPYGYYGQPYGYQAAGYYAGDPNAAYASTYQGYAGGYYGDSPWGYYDCHPGSSLPYNCQPNANAYQNTHN
jgi:hypothetical protein